jgi:chemotaxis protein methyltransferase CheR
MKEDLSVVSALVAERMGLNYPKDRWPDLAQGLAKTAQSLGFADPEEFVAGLATGDFNSREIQALASHLTVPETHFFRSPETFATLQSKVLPELIAERQTAARRLRLWSAGCATGPEPFSLAILLTRLIPDLFDWDVTILATDINPAGFAVAQKGDYTQWSFRGTPAWVLNGYFAKTRDGRYRLSPSIQKMVTFRYLNLVQDPYPTDCDLILCRNVMMYFSRDTTAHVAEGLRRSLREGGYLLVTASETSREVQGHLTALNLGGETFYKKTPAAVQAPAPSPAKVRAPKAKERRHAERAPQPRKSVAQSQQPRLRLERRAYARDGRPPVSQPATTTDVIEAAKEARILADRGALDQALECCERALETEKLNPSLYYLKASILQEMGRALEAEQALQSTLFLDDGFALARVMLGAIARSQSRAQEAARHFREALSALEQMPSDSVLAETNGLTAGEMVETVASLIESERVS